MLNLALICIIEHSYSSSRCNVIYVVIVLVDLITQIVKVVSHPGTTGFCGRCSDIAQTCGRLRE